MWSHVWCCFKALCICLCFYLCEQMPSPIHLAVKIWKLTQDRRTCDVFIVYMVQHCNHLKKMSSARPLSVLSGLLVIMQSVWRCSSGTVCLYESVCACVCSQKIHYSFFCLTRLSSMIREMKLQDKTTDSNGRYCRCGKVCAFVQCVFFNCFSPTYHLLFSFSRPCQSSSRTGACWRCP